MKIVSKQQYLERFKNSNLNNEYRLLSLFKNKQIYIKVLHKMCKTIYDVRLSHFINGVRCRKCANILNKEEFILKYKDYFLENGYLLLDRFIINQTAKIKLKHINCNNEIIIIPYRFFNGQRCKYCCKINSKLVAKVQSYLDLNNLKYEREYRFNDCKNINTLPFDLAVFNEMGEIIQLIECDGDQHYNKNNPYYSEKIIINDKIKTKYCNDNAISLIRIKENQLNILFDILVKIFNKKLIPSDASIDKYYSKKINSNICTNVRNNYLNIKSSLKLSKIYNLSKPSILSILNYKVYENQDLYIKKQILNLLNRRKL